MIFGSLLLIFAAIALAVLGVAEDSNGLLVASIVASLLAAVALVVGARQSTAGVPDDARDAPEPATVGAGVAARGATGGAGGQRLPGTGGTVFTSNNAAAAALDDEPASGAPIPAQAPPLEAGPRTAEPVGVVAGASTAASGTPRGEPVDTVDAADDDPPGEPPEEPASAAQRARVALLDTEVVVLDGRPRYHLADCAHLVGREGSEALPVSEAEELGFTPCSACAPLHTLLAR